jgi:hypothetical protein
MPTLVLSSRYTDDSNSLWRTAIAEGWDVERLRNPQVPEGLAQREPVLYTDTFYASQIAEALSVHLLSPPLDWLVRLPEHYRGRSVRSLKWSDARAITERAFFKPADDKWFPSAVYDSGQTIPTSAEYSPDAPVLVSEVVHFEAEYRLFVLDRKVAASSIYIRNGRRADRLDDGNWNAPEAEHAEALHFAETLLADSSVHLPAAVVLDVGRTRERGWLAVETNPAWASGLCGCDPRAVLPVLRRASEPASLKASSDPNA